MSEISSSTIAIVRLRLSIKREAFFTSSKFGRLSIHPLPSNGGDEEKLHAPSINRTSSCSCLDQVFRFTTFFFTFMTVFHGDASLIQMCMFFLCVNPEADRDEFALVATSIRDEYFSRATRLLHFWEEDHRIVGGMDLESGREGGTWMAMNTRGQIAALLNVLRPVNKVTHGKRNRGFLVPQFLQSNAAGDQFLKSLSSRSRDYADFLMVTVDFDVTKNSSSVSYFTNLETSGDPATVIGQDKQSFAFGNNHPENPWIKTIVTNKMFESITKRNIKTNRRKRLVSELMDMMSDETTYFPDEQLLRDGSGYDRAFLQALSSVRVRIPFVGFGTRTQSVITIDASGRVTFVERTVPSLGHESAECNTWPTRTFRFVVKDDSQKLPIYSLSRL